MGFTRKEIINTFRTKIRKKEPIIIGSPGIGLVAKVQDLSGIDMCMVCNSSYFNMDGHPSITGYLAYGDANNIMFKLGRRILRMTKNTPTIAGVASKDPYRGQDEILDKILEMGFCGVINAPAAAMHLQIFEEKTFDDNSRREMLGWNTDVELIKLCNKRNIFSIGVGMESYDIQTMAAAGADAVCLHMGFTTGGFKGAPADITKTLDEACELTQELYQVAVAENPDILVFCHGGPFVDPATVQTCFDRSDVQGFIGNSALGRLPVEKAITEIVKDLSELVTK